LIVFAQSFETKRLVELHNIAKLIGILPLVVVEAYQSCLHDIDPGHVLGYRKAIGVFFGEPLKIFDDIEKVARRNVTGFRGRDSRGAAAQREDNHCAAK
jgi:hypothetical protein